ncbi:MAG: hypothetical protein DRO14_02635 [Thermoprotei archaeon]|nr:MAG: hypothetical protein DRO14_02635 [Thermoprotei archaeon]
MNTSRYISELIDEFQKVLHSIKPCFKDSKYLESVWNNVVSVSLMMLSENLSSGHLVDVMRTLKFILEAAVQSLYLFVKNKGDDERIWRELRVRGKHAVSFNVRMIANLPNTPRQIKRGIFRTYIAVAKYSHPAHEVLTNPAILAVKTDVPKEILELTRQTLDYVAYLALRLCKLKNCLIRAELNLHIIQSDVCSMYLERACKYISKITKS